MQRLIDNKAIPFLSMILGISICTSTALMSGAYIAIIAVVLLSSHFLYSLKSALKNSYVIASLVFYGVFLVYSVHSEASSSHEISKMLLRIIGYLMVPFFFIAWQKKSFGKFLLIGFLVGALLSAILSIMSWAVHYHILYGVKDNTWVVFHGHILHNAFLAVAACFCLWGAFNKSNTKLQKIYCLVGFLICFIDAMFIVEGRTGQVMLPIMSAFVMVYRFRWKGFILLLVISSLIAPVLLYSNVIKKGITAYQSDVQKYHEGDSVTSVGLRYEFHHNSIELIKKSPIFGYGAGSFATIYKNYTHFTGVRATTNPHSDWLWIAVETGILGIIGFIAFLLFTMMNLFKCNPYHRCMGLALLLGYLLASLQNSFFIDNVTSMAFIYLATAMIALNTTEKRQ